MLIMKNFGKKYHRLSNKNMKKASNKNRIKNRIKKKRSEQNTVCLNFYDYGIKHKTKNEKIRTK